jgi:imidazolonepropionase-like amidohydrolase
MSSTSVVRTTLSALIALAVPLAMRGQTPRASLVIRDVTVIDGTGASPARGMSLVIRDGRIDAIVPAGREPDADLTLDARGLFAIPGLTDGHVHLSGDPWESSVDQLRRALHGGVTAVFDVAGDARETSNLARAALTGEIESPTIYYASLMAGPAFFTDPRVVAASRGFRPGTAPWNREITPETDLVRAVAEAKGAGATFLKLYAALDSVMVTRATAEARRQGLRVMAHSTTFPGKPSDLVSAGVNILTHAAYLVWEGSPRSAEFPKRSRGDFAGVAPDGPVMERLLRAMHDRDVALNPTLWIFASGPAKDSLAARRTPWMNRVTQRAKELGVTIMAGTDGFVDERDPLPLVHRELEALVDAGLTPTQALESATRGAAHAIGIDDIRGTLRAGAVADLVLLAADPTADIRNTRQIRYVVKDGRIVFTAAPRPAR